MPQIVPISHLKSTSEISERCHSGRRLMAVPSVYRLCVEKKGTSESKGSGYVLCSDLSGR